MHTVYNSAGVPCSCFSPCLRYYYRKAYFCRMGRWVFLLFFVFGGLEQAASQSLRHALGIQVAGLDFYGPQTGNFLLNERKVGNSSRQVLYWDPALRLTFAERVSQAFDVLLGLQFSSLDYPSAIKDSQYIFRKQGIAKAGRNELFFSADAGLRLNLLGKENYFCSPFLAAGFSGGWYRQHASFTAPLALGFRIKLARSVYFLVESQYRMPLAEPARTHLLHSAGLVLAWGAKKEAIDKTVAPPPPRPLPLPLAEAMLADTDNDGVPDTDDECPTLPGKRSAKGCPDTDGDGFRDNVDRCPEEAGLARYQGCPIPDRDNDGFDDEVDECPDEAFEDNKGCPYVKKEIRQKVDLAARGIYFERNSAVIDSASFANLDAIVAIMQTQAAFILDIEGHTDSRGAADKNLLLSQQRADACKNYLVSIGIADSRIESVGYGEMNPIADNDTEEGRAKNRRTEFELKWAE